MTRATGIGPLPDLLAAHGSKKLLRAVFADASLPLAIVNERRHQIPIDSLARLYRVAAERTGDVTFGLTAGSTMTPVDYGKWVLYASQASHLQAGISRIIQTLSMHQTGTSMRIAPRPGGHAAWEYWHPGVSTPLFRQHSEHVVPVMIRFIQIFLGQDWRPPWIEVGYSSPDEAGDLEDRTQTAWTFDRPCVAIAIKSDDLSRPPVRFATGPSAVPLVTHAELLAESHLDWPDTTVEHIAGVIALRLLDGDADFEGAAEALGTGCRTLQRRLGDHGLTYRSLLTRIRMQRAKNLIEQTEMPLKAICFELGYSDPAHFSRAFRKHFGYPPSRIQRRALCPDGSALLPCP